ncbi:hypothetical protein FRB95_002307 [Tulasnella sp. JGI-2019a]|nr:hypothetical protein FRB95_002307 [Tulasnella sp. JGI-2019a]
MRLSNFLLRLRDFFLHLGDFFLRELRDFLYLDCEAYSKSIKMLSEEELRRNMRKEIHQMIIYGFGVAGGIAGAIVTNGMCIIGSVYAARKFYIALQKYTLLEAERETRGDLKHTDIGLTWWDVLGSCGVGILTGAAAAVPPAMIGGEIMAYGVIPLMSKVIGSDDIPRIFGFLFDAKTWDPLYSWFQSFVERMRCRTRMYTPWIRTLASVISSKCVSLLQSAYNYCANMFQFR